MKARTVWKARTVCVKCDVCGSEGYMYRDAALMGGLDACTRRCCAGTLRLDGPSFARIDKRYDMSKAELIELIDAGERTIKRLRADLDSDKLRGVMLRQTAQPVSVEPPKRAWGWFWR